MVIPEVVGFKLTGKLHEGATATDLVLTVTQMLRKKGVVDKFVEFYGEGLDDLPLADRATIANMAPEYGATCGFFPVDEITLGYLRTTNRGHGRQAGRGLRQEAGPVAHQEVARAGVHRHAVARPRRRRCRASPAPSARRTACRSTRRRQQFVANMEKEFDRKDDGKRIKCEGADYDLGHGDVVIAAITSCTNTSNPYVMLGAGLVARNAVKHGLKVKPWVKTSLAPGSQVVTDYLEASGLQKDLDKIGFNLVGYGCTTCIGNSGPLPDPVTKAIDDGDLVVCCGAVGQPQLRGPRQSADPRQLPRLADAGGGLCAGRLDEDRHHQGSDRHRQGRQAGLSQGHLALERRGRRSCVDKFVTAKAFKKRYADVFKGDKFWRGDQDQADA